jgi:hypothetical protein
MGMIKSVVERRDEYLADELPNVLHEQLVTQKDIYDVLSDMYESLTGDKHRSKHDEERELKWDAIAGTYLSPDAKREQMEWIKSQVSNILKQQHKDLNKDVEGIGLVDWFRRTVAKWGSDNGFMDTPESIADLAKGLGNEIEELVKNPNLSKTTYQDLFEKQRGQESYLGNHEEIRAALKSLHEKGNTKKQQKAKVEEEGTPKPSIMSNFCDCISQIPDLLRKEPLRVEIVSVSDEFCRKCLSPFPEQLVLPYSQKPLALPYSPGQTVDSLFSFNNPSYHNASILNSSNSSYNKASILNPYDSSYHNASILNSSNSSCHNASILNPSNCFPVKICDDNLLDFSNALASSISKANDNKSDLKKKKLYEIIIEHVPKIYEVLSKISKHEEDQSETKNKKSSFLSYIKSFLSEKFLSGKFKELFDKGIKNFILDIIKSDINTVKRIGLGAIESVISKIKSVKDAVKNVKYIGLGVVKSVIDKIKGIKDIGLSIVKSVIDKIKSVKDTGLSIAKSVVDKIKRAKDAGLNTAKSVVDKIKGVKDAGLDMFKSGIDKIKGAKDAGLLSVKNIFSTIKGVGLGTAETVMNAVKNVKNAGLSGIFNMIKSNIFKSKKSADDSQEDNVGKEIVEIDERNLKMKQVKAYDAIIEYLPDIYNILSNKPIKREGDQSDNKKDKDKDGGGSSFLSDMAGNIGSFLLDGFLLSRFKWLRKLPGKDKFKWLRGLFGKGNSVLKWVRGLFGKGAAKGAAEGVAEGAVKGAEAAITAAKGATEGAAKGAAEGIGLGAAKGAETAITAAKGAEAAAEGAGLGAAKGAETAINAAKGAEGAGLGAAKGAETAITAAKGATKGATKGIETGLLQGGKISLKSLAKSAKGKGGLLTAALGLYTAHEAYKEGGIKAAAVDVAGTLGAIAGGTLGNFVVPGAGLVIGSIIGEQLGEYIGEKVISSMDDPMSDQTKKIDEIQKNITQNDETHNENKKPNTGANEIDIAKIFDKTDPDSPLNKFLTATEALLAASQAIIAGSTVMAKSTSIQPSQIPAVVPSAPATQQPSKGLDSMIYNLFETDNVNGLRNGLIKFGLGEQHAYA